MAKMVRTAKKKGVCVPLIWYFDIFDILCSPHLIAVPRAKVLKICHFGKFCVPPVVASTFFSQVIIICDPPKKVHRCALFGNQNFGPTGRPRAPKKTGAYGRFWYLGIPHMGFPKTSAWFLYHFGEFGGLKNWKYGGVVQFRVVESASRLDHP